MYVIIPFDISDDKIRYRVVKELKGAGYRVQKSVFECPGLTEKNLAKLKERLAALIDHGTDSIRYYRLCKSCLAEVTWEGSGAPPHDEDCAVV